jgi:hypothetical protein
MTETVLFLGLAGLTFSFFFTFVVWAITWKGVALWTAAKNKSKAWFIALLLLNTLTILEILYVLYFSKKKTLKSVDEKIDEVSEKISENI